MRKYLDKDNLNEINIKFCVWGTGIDSEELINALDDSEKIAFFIDNNRAGNKLYGKDIVSFEEYRKNNKHIPIVIATYRFANEIYAQIESASLEELVYIWDNQHIFSSNKKIRDFIKFNIEQWESDKNGSDKENIVLMPFDNRHAIRPIIHGAYCANYFANVYDAKILGYFRFGGKKENVSDVVYDVYSSINMLDVIDYRLNDKQLAEAIKQTDEIWANLNDWKDWNNITINGIHIGTTVIRHINRHYIPSFKPNDERMKSILFDAISTFIFWYEYIYQNSIKVVLLADGVCWDGYIRDIAISKGIDTYIIDEFFQKATLDYYRNPHISYLGTFWNELTIYEKEAGISWAKKQLDERVGGEIGYIQRANDINTFAIEFKNRVTEVNDKTKVLICPHIFEEDSYQCGEHIFDNNYMEWLAYLGNISNELDTYDWYIKMHPASSKRDYIIIDDFLERYPKIKRIDKEISPKQLKEEGVAWALTVCGTISQEYPLIGIQVINAGRNPGECFDFAWNPKSKEEYDFLIRHLDVLPHKENYDDIYKFYAINYYYYDRKDYFLSNIFFDDIRLEWSRRTLNRSGLDFGPWQYNIYINEMSVEKDKCIKKRIPEIFKELDEWRPDYFYRKF